MSAKPKSTREALLEELGTEADATTALAVLAYVKEQGIAPAAEYTLGSKTTAAFELRIKGLAHFSNTEAYGLYSLASAIIGASLVLARRRLVVRVRRASAPRTAALRESYVPPARPSPRPMAVAYADMGIEHEDDCAHLDTVLDAVYGLYEHMPPLHTWIETIGARGDGTDDEAALTSLSAPPLGEEAAASESELPAIGYAVCFESLPDFSGAFLEHLCSRYGAFVTRACVWFTHDNAAPPVLAVSVRRAALVASADAAGTHRPAGNPLRVAGPASKRARH